MKSAFKIATGVAALAMVASSAYAGTLDDVKKRGVLKCGVSTGLPGFTAISDAKKYTGLDVDTCRAVAAAVLGDANKVEFTALTAKERFTSLSGGDIDMLARNSTWTLDRDAAKGLNFTGVNYYDGQGFLVPIALGVKSALELDGAKLCIQAGTTTELNLADYFKEHGMSYKVETFDTSEQTIGSFEAGGCDILTSDQSQLYALRSKMKNPSSAVVLPEVISKEPLGPVVRQGDDEWFNIVKWVLFAQVNAEELGVTSANADSMKSSKNGSTLRLLGVTPGMGAKLHLGEDWAYNAVKQVGNYGEMFERNVGLNTPLAIARGLNALWNKGGLQYAPPIR